jgi:nucleoside-diphosphate-sugar epimerase
MLQKGVRNDDFNVCGNNTLRMDELAKKIWGCVNPGIPFPGFKHMPVSPADVRYRVGVSDKAKSLLGWRPRYELDYIVNDSLAFIREKLAIPK